MGGCPHLCLDLLFVCTGVSVVVYAATRHTMLKQALETKVGVVSYMDLIRRCAYIYIYICMYVSVCLVRKYVGIFCFFVVYVFVV